MLKTLSGETKSTRIWQKEYFTFLFSLAQKVVIPKVARSVYRWPDPARVPGQHF